ncbi:cytochrome P450 [Pyrenochaeta sp. DS3sAY3a]|nr:cytochrome P450 [Pyrenochaeta sp. DS3sAY3a]
MPVILETLILALALLFALSYARLWTSPAQHEAKSKDEKPFWVSRNVVGVESDSPLRWLWARLISIKYICVWTTEGYAKYCQRSLPFTVPTLDAGPVLALPINLIKPIYSLPEHILNVHGVQDETMQVHWVFPDKYLRRERFQFNVVRNQLTQNIPALTGTVAQEIRWGFERAWGMDREWKEVRVWPNALRIVAGAANGVFCGAPLCTDIVFLDRMKDHAMTIFAGALLLNCVPKILHPIFGPLLSLASAIMGHRAMKRSLPIVKERLALTEKWNAETDPKWSLPNDALQWLITESTLSSNPTAQLTPHRLALRLLFVNDVSMLTTAYTAQNLILDLFSTPPSANYIPLLRAECAAALAASHGIWDTEAVGRLRGVDSAIRESMRLNPFGTLILPREVVAEEGVDVPGVGRVPRGTRIAVPSEAIQRDGSVYDDPDTYLPFRFAQPSTTTSSSPSSSPQPPRHAVTLDPTFLAFGVPGRWACPGRFFAIMELKIFVAEMLLHYDVEFLERRPGPVYALWSRYPPDVGVRVRRRV